MSNDSIDNKQKAVAVQMDQDELASLINTLSFAKSVFEKSAEMTLKTGDSESAEKLNVRAQTCTTFINSLLKNMQIGEPENHIFH